MTASRTITCDDLQALALDLAAAEKRRLEADAERIYGAAGALWNSAVTIVLKQHGEEKAPPGVVARKGADGKIVLEIPGAAAPPAEADYQRYAGQPRTARPPLLEPDPAPESAAPAAG